MTRKWYTVLSVDWALMVNPFICGGGGGIPTGWVSLLSRVLFRIQESLEAQSDEHLRLCIFVWILWVLVCSLVSPLSQKEKKLFSR